MSYVATVPYSCYRLLLFCNSNSQVTILELFLNSPRVFHYLGLSSNYESVQSLIQLKFIGSNFSSSLNSFFNRFELSTECYLWRTIDARTNQTLKLGLLINQPEPHAIA